jgi:hypothetical protein
MKSLIIKRHGKIVMEEVGQKQNKTLIILGILLFIGAMLLVGSLDYKVLVM